MELVITREIRIVVRDRLNFIVQVVGVRTEGEHIGEKYWIDRGHYIAIDAALQSLVTKAMVADEVLAKVKRLLEVFAYAVHTIEKATEGFISPFEAAKLEGQIYVDIGKEVWKR